MMFLSVVIGCAVALGQSGPTASRPASQPTDWGDLFRWLRVAATVPSTRPAVDRPLQVNLWAEAFGRTARLSPKEILAFCLLRAGRERYFSQRLRPTGPIALPAGRPTPFLTADVLEQRFFVYDGRLKLIDGYPAPRPGAPAPRSAGRGRNLFKIGRYAMQVFVYVAPADDRPAAMARTAVIKFEIVPARPLDLTAEQQSAYERLAPRFRRGVVSASKAAPEAVHVGAAAVPTLRILLGPDEPHYARAWATDALCKIVDPAATAVLREMIREPKLGDRNVVGYRLMPRRDRDATNLIVELLQARKGPVPRLWIARGFVDFRRKFRGKAAELLLASGNPKVLYLCGMAMQRGTFGKAQSQRIFDSRGEDGLRSRAAGALIDGLDQADEALRPHVFSALGRLTGLAHKTVAAWRTWKKRHVDKDE